MLPPRLPAEGQDAARCPPHRHPAAPRPAPLSPPRHAEPCPPPPLSLTPHPGVLPAPMALELGAEALLDLSFLTEDERRAIAEVLRRDSQLRRREEGRIR